MATIGEDSRSFLTDEELATIAWADPAEPTKALARRLGRSSVTVLGARRRNSTLGCWGCPLEWRTCAQCGQPLAVRPRFPRLCHQGCETAYRSARTVAWDRKRHAGDAIKRGLMSDEELAEVAWADPTESKSSLAKRLRRHPSTIGSMRNHLREQGCWGCPIEWKTCERCGRPLAVQPREGPVKRKNHKRCGEEQRKEYLRRWIRHRARRWLAEGPPEKRAALAESAAMYDAHAYAETVAHLRYYRVKWTEDEDEILISMIDKKDREIALELGRTLFAVRARTVLLRKRGILPPAPNYDDE